MYKKCKWAGRMLLVFAAALAVNLVFDHFFTQLADSRHHWILPYYEIVLASLVAILFLRNRKRS